MIKNIGKLKQWTGEKFGSDKLTQQTEDFQRLEDETERKRVGYEKVHTAALVMHTQTVKRKISPEDNKTKRLPGDLFGVCLKGYGGEFSDDAALGIALHHFGQAQSDVANLQEDFADSMKYTYLDKLDEGLQQFKEYQQLRKKLESRRLDYDAKLGRLQKSKKEKPELEQEMQAAKIKYEDTEYEVIQRMAMLQEFEDEHCDALYKLLETQCEYLSRSLQTLESVRSNWGQGVPSNTRAQKLNSLTRISSNHSESQMLDRSLSKQNSLDSTLSIPRRMPRRNSNLSDREDSPARTPPVLPRRQSQSTGSKSQRKAVYDFGGDNSDELSFNTGEVIQVVEEVDEGWWVGEINSPNGTRRGIFPVNYTEPMQTPPMPARPILTNSRSSTTAYNQIPEEPSYYEEPAALHSESPFGDANRSGTQSPARPVNNRFGPQRTLSSTTSTKPITPSINNKPAQRAPPPPPPASRTPPVARNYGSRTAPTTPHIPHQQTNDYFESSPGCAECDCQDYVANLFKKGYCNNCFHKH